MIDLRINKYPICFGKCVLHGEDEVRYFNSYRKKSNGKFWMRISAPSNSRGTSKWHKPLYRSMSLSMFSYLELK